MDKIFANRPIHSKETFVTSLAPISGSNVQSSPDEIAEKYAILKMRMNANNYMELTAAEHIEKCFGKDYQSMIDVRNYKHNKFFIHKYSIFFNLIYEKEYKELLNWFKQNRGNAALVLAEANENKMFTLAITFRTKPDGTIQQFIADKSGKFPVWFASKEEFEQSSWNTNFNTKTSQNSNYINGIVFIKDESTGISRQAKIEPTIEDVPFYFLQEFKNSILSENMNVENDISELTKKIERELYAKVESEVKSKLTAEYFAEIESKIRQEILNEAKEPKINDPEIDKLIKEQQPQPQQSQTNKKK